MSSGERVVPTTWRGYLAETKSSFSVLKWIWTDLMNAQGRSMAKRFSLFIGLAIMVGSLTPYAMQRIVSALMHHDTSDVWFWLGAYAFAMLVARAFSFAQIRYQELSWIDIYGALERSVNRRFFEKSLGQHQRESKLLAASSIEKGRGAAQFMIDTLLWSGFGAVIRFCVTFVYLWIVSPLAGSIMSLGILLHLVWSVYLNWQSVKNFSSVEEQYRKHGRYKTDRIHNVERVKTNARSDEEVETMAGWMRRIMDADAVYSLKQAGMFAIRDLMLLGCVLTSTALVLRSVLAGELTPESFIPIFSWSWTTTDQMHQIAQVERAVTKQLAPVQNLRKALMLPVEAADHAEAISLPEGPLHVRIDNASFAYTPEEDKRTNPVVLRGVSLDIAPGMRVGLIGHSGIGKTTIGRLLLRYSDPDSGSISVNGIDLRTVRRQSWASVTGLISQQSAVFDGTLRENLVYGLDDERQLTITDEELWSIVKTLRIDFGTRLTHGLDTRVGNRGIKLSGGEAQRLMIGAAIIRGPKFLVIDEATSSLDSTTEREVLEGILTLLPRETSVVMIAHRISTLRSLCTSYAVISNAGGASVETQTSAFDDLWESSPTFIELARTQGYHRDALSSAS
jgi:ATP-binding cassette subfamily B protein